MKLITFLFLIGLGSVFGSGLGLGTSNSAVPDSAKAPIEESAAMRGKMEKLRGELKGYDPQQEIAAAAKAQETSESAKRVSVWGLLLQVILALILVLVMAVGAVKLLKKLQRTSFLRGPNQARNELFEIVETFHLGQHQKLMAVRVGKDISILGVTQHNINLLKELPDSFAGQLTNRESVAPNSRNFAETMNVVLDRFKKPKKVSDFLEGN